MLRGQTQTFSSKLVFAHLRRMGLANRAGFPVGVFADPCPTAKAMAYTVHAGPDQSHRRGSLGVVEERRDCPCVPTPPGVPQQHLPSGKTGWGLQAGDKSPGIEHLASLSPLQNGGYPPPEGSFAGQGLDGAPGSQGRLVDDTDFSASQAFSPISLGLTDLRVRLPPFRAVLRFVVFHQSFETGGGVPQIRGRSFDHIPRRYAFYASEPSDSLNSPSAGGLAPGVPRFHYQCSQVGSHPFSEDAVPRIYDRFIHGYAVPSHAEVVQDQTRTSTDFGKTVDIVTPLGANCGSVVVVDSGHFSGTSALQSPSAPQGDPPAQRPFVLSGSSSLRGGQGRVTVVDRPHGGLEWPGYLRLAKQDSCLCTQCG